MVDYLIFRYDFLASATWLSGKLTSVIFCWELYTCWILSMFSMFSWMTFCRIKEIRNPMGKRSWTSPARGVRDISNTTLLNSLSRALVQMCILANSYYKLSNSNFKLALNSSKQSWTSLRDKRFNVGNWSFETHWNLHIELYIFLQLFLNLVPYNEEFI